MDSRERKTLLEQAGFAPEFVDEIVAADGQAEEAGITPELIERTVEHASTPPYEPCQKRFFILSLI